jgi:hypothetical protein
MPASSDDLPGRNPPRKQRRTAERAENKRRGKRRGKQPGSPGAATRWEVPARTEVHFPEGACSCGRDLPDAADPAGDCEGAGDLADGIAALPVAAGLGVHAPGHLGLPGRELGLAAGGPALGVEGAGRDLRCHVPQRRVQSAGLFGKQRVRVLPQPQAGQRRPLLALPRLARQQLRAGRASGRRPRRRSRGT